MRDIINTIIYSLVGTAVALLVLGVFTTWIVWVTAGEN